MAEIVLFDLDGTLVDTAPSLNGIVNAMLHESGLPLLPLAQARNLVSRGARGLLLRAFGEHRHAARDAELQSRFIELYEAASHSESRIFIDLAGLFNASSKISAYGIVTNKPTRLTELLLARLDLPRRPDCIVCGDTLDRKKPDPAPLLHAAAALGANPADCVYVGDDARDVTAGRAAGMGTLAAAWGYIPPGTDYAAWGADGIVRHPSRLAAALASLDRARETSRSRA